MGRVLLAGKVIEHAIGYRAERARIAELIPTTTDEGITRSLATRLGLPVGPTLDTAQVLSELDLMSGPTGRPARRRLLDQWRLKMHRRHFRVIRGSRDG